MLGRRLMMAAANSGLSEFSFIDSASSGTNATSYTFSSKSFGTAHANRVIVVGVLSYCSGSSHVIGSVTIGGVSATQIRRSDSDVQGSAIWAAVVPTGTTGDIVVDGSPDTLDWCAIGWWRMVTGNGITSYATAQNRTDPIDIDVNTVAGGAVTAVAMSTSGSISWTGPTEQFNTTVESDPYSGAHTYPTTAQTPMNIAASVGADGAGTAVSWPA